MFCQNPLLETNMTHLCFFFILWSFIACAIMLAALAAEAIDRIGVLPVVV